MTPSEVVALAKEHDVKIVDLKIHGSAWDVATLFPDGRGTDRRPV